MADHDKVREELIRSVLEGQDDESAEQDDQPKKSAAPRPQAPKRSPKKPQDEIEKMSAEAVAALAAVFQSVDKEKGDPDFYEAAKQIKKMGYKYTPHQLSMLYEAFLQDPSLVGLMTKARNLYAQEVIPEILVSLKGTMLSVLDAAKTKADSYALSQESLGKESLKSLVQAMTGLKDMMMRFGEMSSEIHAKQEVEVNVFTPPRMIEVNEIPVEEAEGEILDGELEETTGETE